MELAFACRLDADLERVMILDRAPTGDPLLDRVLERIADDVETRDTRAWIETLSVEETAAIEEHALANLVERRILRRKEKRRFQETVEHLWVFRSPVRLNRPVVRLLFTIRPDIQENEETLYSDRLRKRPDEESVRAAGHPESGVPNHGIRRRQPIENPD